MLSVDICDAGINLTFLFFSEDRRLDVKLLAPHCIFDVCNAKSTVEIN